jgi:hypothetical protein
MNKLFLNIFIYGVLISAPLYPNWIKTPEDLSSWLQTNFTYQAEEDGKDYWKKPFETIRDKGGDCEDIALLADKILSNLGYETKVIAIYGQIFGHAICVINKNNKYTFFSNQYYYNKEFNNIYNLLENNYPTWDSYYTIYQNGKRVNHIRK